MKLLDPLQGYKLAARIIYLQLAFALAMVVLLWKGELDMANRDYAIAVMFTVHIISYATEYFSNLMGLLGKDTGALKYTLTFVNAALYQGAVFYAQVKFLKSTFDDVATPTPEEVELDQRAKQWLVLEISFYYTSLLLTIIFLLFQSVFKIEVPKSGRGRVTSAAASNPATSINTAPENQQELLNEDAEKQDPAVAYDIDDFWSADNQNQDFLELIQHELQVYLSYGIITAFSIMVLILQERETEHMSYKYSIYALAALTGVSFLHVVVDYFTKIQFPEWYKNLGYVIGAGVAGVVVWMIVQLSVHGNYEHLFRYWILIVIFINLAVIIQFSTTKIVHRVKGTSYNNQEGDKVTLAPKFLSSITFNVDIYAITFMSYAELDQIKPRDEIASQNHVSPLLKQFKRPASSEEEEDMGEIPNSEVLANKNFSNSAFIFLFQMVLIYLVFSEFATTEVIDVTFQVLLARIVCAALLHMQLEGEIRQAIQMLDYARLMVYHSKYRIPMVITSIMQFIGALATEIICIVLICQQGSVQDVIMNFIALGVIAEIDDIYAGTLYQNRIKQEIEQGKTLPINP